MDKERFEKGLGIRRAVLGAEFVDNAIKTADDFSRPLQELVTRVLLGRSLGSSRAGSQDTQHAESRDAVGTEPAA